MADYELEQNPWDRSGPSEEPWECTPRGPKGPRHVNRIVFIGFLILIVGAAAVVLFLRFSPLAELTVGGSLPEPAATSSTLSSAPTIARYPAGDTVSLELVSGADLEDLSYQEIYRKTIPSVVTVRTILTSSYGVGTGIILTSDGYILTNSHVIENGSSVVVVLNSGAEYQAKLVGRDSETDLAVLKIGAAHLTPAEFGDPDELVVGDEALAIGNPLGEQLRGTLTNGIISAINRNVSVNGRTMTLIQTTAALNEGNSGGPLINLKGQVIGINTIKMMSTYSTIEGLGFAIPISSAKPIVEELISQGYLTARLTIGIYGVAWTEPEGVRVDSVIDGTGAADAGLQSDDVITAINGTHVANVDQVNDIKSNFKPGDFLTMTVDRDGETLTLEVEIRDQNDIE